MKYNCYDMNAYNLHIIKTDKFKTITMGVSFRRKIVKEEITIRNLLKELMINSTANYPTEKSLIIETERLYDLKLVASNYRVGNYSILNFRERFLNEKYTEKGMNSESIKFLIDLIFNPFLSNDFDKCKKKIEKSIKSLNDNKVKYALNKLLESTGDMPYSYNGYGYIEDLDKISLEDIQKYYDSMIKDDLIDVYIVGNVDDGEIKEIFKNNFKAKTFHNKNVLDVVAPELSSVRKINEISCKDNVNQTQLTLLCNFNGLTDNERKYVLPVYNEILGGSANSILFDTVREKNSYAYYVNSIVKAYDNILIIYSGIEPGKEDNVKRLVIKTLKCFYKDNLDEKLDSAKKTIISAIKFSEDNPIGIIDNYYAMTLVEAKDINERIKMINNVTMEDIRTVAKKLSVHTLFTLEAINEENNN